MYLSGGQLELNRDSRWSELNVYCLSTLCLIANMCNFELFGHSCTAVDVEVDPHSVKYEKCLVSPPIASGVHFKHDWLIYSLVA